MNARVRLVAKAGKVVPFPRGINPLYTEVEWQGRCQTLAKWAKENGVSASWAKHRARRCPWPEPIVHRPQGLRVMWKGVEVRLRDLLRQHGVHIGAYTGRRLRGWSLEEAVLGRPRASRYQHAGAEQPTDLETVRACFEGHIIEHPSGHWEMNYPESTRVFGWTEGGRCIRLTHRRAAWVLYRGDIKPGWQHIRVTCGKRWCVCPEHLESHKTPQEKP